MKLKLSIVLLLFFSILFFVSVWSFLNSETYRKQVITDEFLGYFEKTNGEFTDKALGIKDSYPFSDSRFYFNQDNDKLVEIGLFVPIDENNNMLTAYLFLPFSERKDMKKVEIFCSFSDFGEMYSHSPEDESICLDSIKFVVENK